MTDKLTKILALNNEVRIVIVEAKEIVQEAQSRHDSWQTATAAFGRTIVGTLLLASNLKGNDRLSVTIQGQGPIGAIFVDADAQGNVRGYVQQAHVALDLNPHGKIDVSGGIGLPAMMTVKKFIENFEPFIGQVDLVSGEIAEDFTYYMAVSEQTPSSFGLSIVVNPDETIASAGGFMIQLMPGASEEAIQTLEKGISNLPKLSELFASDQPVEQLMTYFCSEDQYQVLEQMDIHWQCTCSKERFAEGLMRIDQKELEAMAQEDHGAEIICQFCKEAYHFTEADLHEMIRQKEAE